MAISNRQRIDEGLNILREGLVPFVERECKARLGDEWLVKVNERIQFPLKIEDGKILWDSHALLSALWDFWDKVFKTVLAKPHKGLLTELRSVRNDHAHEKAFNYDRTYRSLDTMKMLLEAVSASDDAAKLQKMADAVMRVKIQEQSRGRVRNSQPTLAGMPMDGLKPWRDVIVPHADVASGNFQQAEFAADLAQVHKGEGSSEYKDPEEFFRRTFITKGLRELLLKGIRRVSGDGGDPVVELRTNFGGGKTHSMLALYHLFSGLGAELSGMEPLLEELDLRKAPEARRAVLVGTDFGPAESRIKSDGTVVNTWWGEMAWQLAGAEGYALIAASDRASVSPGKDDLLPVFKLAGPSVILIDEWVAYLRQLYKVDGLAGGAFDANLTFAQVLTEAVAACDNVLLIASLPASLIEIGGEGGEEALERLKQTFTRVASSWKPADADEGFEIVRRRLFDTVTDAASKDATVTAFARMYQEQATEFPSGCNEGEYKRRLELAYPIHPQLFDVLYESWSTLDKFQRTRGVLRLMASVIHALWESGDKNLLILPSSIPLSDPAVSSEILRYLPDNWDAIVAADIDGEQSKALAIDGDNNNLGRYSATRRAARVVFLETAPLVGTDNQGVDTRTVKLGCAQPGETVPTFGDALRRLSDQATYMCVDGPSNWFDTQPNVNRTANDRANMLDEHDVDAHIISVLRQSNSGAASRADFTGLHLAPEDSADVPDDQDTRLILLSPDMGHTRNKMDSDGIKAATLFLNQRGNSPRIYRNSLVFLAPDAKKMEPVRQAARQFLAWESVVRDTESMNLTNFAQKQAKSKVHESEATLALRIEETWCWCMTPTQEAGSGDVDWDQVKLTGNGALAERASKKLIEAGSLCNVLGGPILKHHLDRWLWANDDYIKLNKIRDDFASYLYLPRLTNSTVLTTGVGEALARDVFNEDFAYADRLTEGEYVGLRNSGNATPILDGHSVLVKYAAAKIILDKLMPEPLQPGPDDPVVELPVVEKKIRSYYGAIELKADRPVIHLGKLTQEVIQHMSTQPGAKVRLSLRVDIEFADGLEENTQRTVLENSKFLKFDDFGFQKE